jgi:hypothetical protein
VLAPQSCRAKWGLECAIALWEFLNGTCSAPFLPPTQASYEIYFNEQDALVQVFALHPLYLSLKQTLRESSPEIEAAILSAQQKLEALPCVDYVETKQCKMDIARRIFELQGDQDMQVCRTNFHPTLFP